MKDEFVFLCFLSGPRQNHKLQLILTVYNFKTVVTLFPFNFLNNIVIILKVFCVVYYYSVWVYLISYHYKWPIGAKTLQAKLKTQLLVFT